MISYEHAIQIAEDRIAEWNREDNDFVILSHRIIEKPYAWIIPYTSKRWYETKDIRYAIAGNSPFIIAKYAGEVTVYSSAYNMASMIELYEEERGLYGLKIISDLSGGAAKLLVKNVLQLSNQEIMAHAKNSSPWIVRGGQKRMENACAQMQKKGLQARVELCS